MYTFTRGKPILGCTRHTTGIQFGIFSDTACCMLLCLYTKRFDATPVLTVLLDRMHDATGDIFHMCIENLVAIEAYTWQVQNAQGLLSPILIDPYAYAVAPIDAPHNLYRNLVVEALEPPRQSPRIPWDQTILYELHVGHFTKSESSGVNSLHRGKFSGLIEKLPYLKRLGVTSLELMPVFKWNRHILRQTHPLTGELMKDTWGYNTIAFFALDEAYCIDPMTGREEFRQLVNAAHEMGMEIILDVVYNHSGEGDRNDPPIHFKYLSDGTYYKKAGPHYLNCAGTGNVLQTTHIVVKDMILESLRYWVTTFAIDGFRFDLASVLQQDAEGNWMSYGLLNDIASDPILKHVKLISESWDAKGNYDVGKMPVPFREWSDRFRDTMRRVVRGDVGVIHEVATAILGEEIHFKDPLKSTNAAIHFITAHDGFTMWDLVSYNEKHNELNGEQNRDGHNGNYSANCGVEGSTTNEEVLSLRIKRVKNYYVLLLLSRGVPMLQMADELGRTQHGNNNAYCQDHEGVWVNWQVQDRVDEITTLVQQLIEIRRQNDWIGQKDNIDISWHGVRYNTPDWSYYSRSLAWEVIKAHKRFYITLNCFSETLNFELPPSSKKWQKIIDTDKKQSMLQFRYYADPIEPITSYSICVFKEVD